MASTFTVKALKDYMGAGLNILIAGPHGVGKTKKLEQACGELGFKYKYYNTSTLDVFTDLIGIPVPDRATKTVEYYRPTEIDAAEVLIFDELNRAGDKTLNTVMEIILEGSLNGQPLKNLKLVVAAMNPVSDDYATEELDKALVDRFDVYLNAEPEAEISYFTSKFGDKLGKAAVSWWVEYHSSVKSTSNLSTGDSRKVPYLAPRRLDKIVTAFLKLTRKQTIIDCLPPEITDQSVASSLYRELNRAIQPASKANDLEEEITAFTNSPISVQRNVKSSADKVRAFLKHEELTPALRAKLLTSLAISLNSQVGPASLTKNFGEAILAMDHSERALLESQWPTNKSIDLSIELRKIRAV